MVISRWLVDNKSDKLAMSAVLQPLGKPPNLTVSVEESENFKELC